MVQMVKTKQTNTPHLFQILKISAQGLREGTD